MISSRWEKYRHSWFEEDEGNRYKLEHFHEILEPYITPLLENNILLHKTGNDFQNAEVLLPYHCRNAIKALRTLHTQLESFASLLKDPSSLPLVLLALRYRLLDECYYLEEQTCKLISLLSNYNEIVAESSLCSIQQRKQINTIFLTLSQHLNDLPTKTSFLLDEARFHERKLYSVVVPNN